MYNRREFIKRTGLGALTLGGLTYSSISKESSLLSSSKPNIIFILSDDLSYRDLSSYGQKQFNTPNIDRLATNGIRFSQAYSGSPECAPSRASLMTGKHMGHCRIRANRSVRGQDHLLDEDITVAEVLKKAGYTTGFIGKWGIGLPGTEGVPHKQGFDYAYGYYDQLRAHGFYPDYLMENGKRIVLSENHSFNMERVYKYNRRTVDNLDGVENTYDKNGSFIADGVADPSKVKHSEDMFQDAALSFIRKNNENPFFLYYATQLPHGPTITPSLGDYRDKEWSLKHREWAAMMTHLDNGVEKLLTLLDELGISENTIIFFAGDNGYSHYGYFGRKAWEDDPLFRNKGDWRAGKFICREGGLRVPFFVNWPGYIEAGESGHICSLYDFFATAADLAGVKLTHQNDGISIVPELANRPEMQENHEYLYWENGTINPHGQAVRVGEWHAYRKHPSQPTELYRIESDPACTENLAGNNPEIIKKIEGIFSSARTDSEWYINPGESEADIARKKKLADDMNMQQVPVRANTTYRRK